MSLLIRVELPTYSHSFQVSVPSICTIIDVKREIEKVCVGSPRVHGQRLIWRGRFLDDNEKVLDIWKVRRSPLQSTAFVQAHGFFLYLWIILGRNSRRMIYPLCIFPSTHQLGPPQPPTLLRLWSILVQWHPRLSPLQPMLPN
jgi:hypothetical protein